jgi:SAM-dependent methyltransferase
VESGHKAPINYHARLLSDVHRMDAYERAVRALVRPGDVVLDLGCGTGILSLLAARRGAARVHAVESTDIAETALKIIDENGFSSIIQLHRADARTLSPAEPVDLVVSDFLGVFLVDDWMLPAVAAAGRWLKPGGRFCPSRVRLQLAPVGDFPLSPISVFTESFYGVSLRAAHEKALCATYRGNLAPFTLMAPALEYHAFAPPGPPEPFDRTLNFRMTRAGRLRALAGWFTAELAPGVTLSTEPGVETHWQQYLFPLEETALAAGDSLEVRLWLDGNSWCWQARSSTGVEWNARER